MTEEDQASSSADEFSGGPVGWHYFCPGRDLRHGPVSLTAGGRRIVVFRSQGGAVSALDARCCHLGADLGLGSVVGERLRCGLHGWEFEADGRCGRIPCTENIPRFARQTAYPVQEIAGHVFVFNRPCAAYTMPFFEGVEPEGLVSARPYRISVDTPWHLVSANAFDVQHFNCAHDRRLAGPVRVDDLGPFARRLTAEFQVTGHAWRDRLTRWASGDRLTMSITVWGGLLMFVEASFRRTTTYGLLCLLPAGPERTEAVNIIFIKRGRGALHLALDPINVHIRRSFIRSFLASDVRLLQGLRYSPATLLDEDRVMLEYLQWLRTAARPATAGQANGLKEAACEQSSSSQH